MVTRAQGPARLRSGGVAKVAKTILKRILQTIPVLFVVVTITFVLTRMIPGDPAAQMLGRLGVAVLVGAQHRGEATDRDSLREMYLRLHEMTMATWGTDRVHTSKELTR